MTNAFVPVFLKKKRKWAGDSQNPEKKAQHRAKVLQGANSDQVWDNTVISNLWTAKICLPVTQTTLLVLVLLHVVNTQRKSTKISNQPELGWMQ